MEIYEKCLFDAMNWFNCWSFVFLFMNKRLIFCCCGDTCASSSSLKEVKTENHHFKTVRINIFLLKNAVFWKQINIWRCRTVCRVRRRANKFHIRFIVSRWCELNTDQSRDSRVHTEKPATGEYFQSLERRSKAAQFEKWGLKTNKWLVNQFSLK